jgi:SAM-dependent methyltransferase
VRVEELLDKCICKDLIDLTISGQKRKDETLPVKIKIRPVMLKDSMEYQASQYIGKKVIHQNFDKEQLAERIKAWLTSDYSQAVFTLTDASAQILSGKKGNMTAKYKKAQEVRVQRDLSHNRTKKYVLPEGQPVDFLIDLGVMTKEGRIVQKRYDKYRQINRFLEFIEDILPQLDKTKEQTIIDFGCGKSYLTFAMYYYLKVLKGYDIRVIGLDLKEDVIAHCNDLRKRYGYEKLDFYVGDIASYKDVDSVDMVVTLHACDTATDFALEKAVKWGAKIILSVPCCQHEANMTIDNELLKPVLKYGILKERMAALMTDAVRAEMLEGKGYDTQILEFIDIEHTPKNLLIRAVKNDSKDSGKRKAAVEAALKMEKEFNIDLTGNIICK